MKKFFKSNLGAALIGILWAILVEGMRRIFGWEDWQEAMVLFGMPLLGLAISFVLIFVIIRPWDKS